MKLSMSRPLLIRGKIVQPDGTALDRFVMVRDGAVESVSRQRPPLTNDAVMVQTGPNDWIFPGLLDLHSHTDKNVMPIWDYRKQYGKPFFENRFRWRKDKDYRRDIRDLGKKVKKECRQNIIPTFAELQAVAGGTTVLQEDWDLDQQIGDGENPLLCRGTGDPTDFGLPKSQRVLSVIDFFSPNSSYRKANLRTDFNDKKKVVIEQYAKQRHKLQATLVHLAEGRSGFGSDEPGVDPYTRLEFEALMAHPAMKDAGKVRSSPLTLIHGCGIDVCDPTHIKFLRDRNISLIWSPVSNLLLYGDTLEVEPLINSGVNVALGSDWSPSGSKHIWDEAKNAKFFFEAIGSIVSDVQVFQMVTTRASRCIGLDHLGKIAPGGPADFFILRSPLASDNAMEVFFKTEDRDVRAVIIGGRPIYGERDFFEPFDLTLQSLPSVEGSAVKTKVVHLPGHIDVQIERDIDEIERAFKRHGVMRSNLLVSSDTPYRELISELRSYMVRFGWEVQRWRHTRRRSGAPVPPGAARVWRGFSANGMKRERFRQKLQTTFIPGTPQFQSPLGLTSYLPAVLPDEVPDSIPNEIALVFYESQEDYNQAKDSVAGRAYADLHGTVFSFQAPRRSTSAWPTMFEGKLELEMPYFLFDQHVDWQSGSSYVLVASQPDSMTDAKFLQHIRKQLKKVQLRKQTELDGAVGVVGEGYFVYWEHWPQAKPSEDSSIEALAEGMDVHMSRKCDTVHVPLGLHSSYPGLPEVSGGDAFNVLFARRNEID